MIDVSLVPPVTARCYCKHQYLTHVSLEFVNTSLECLVDHCDCRRFKWTTKDKNRFYGIKKSKEKGRSC